VHVSWSVEDPESGASPDGGCQESRITQDIPELVLVCSATNGDGLTASKSVTIRIDRFVPSVVFSTGSQLGAPIFGQHAFLSARAVDANGITRVDFFLDGQLLGVATKPDADGAYSVALDTTAFSEEAPPAIAALAYDATG